MIDDNEETDALLEDTDTEVDALGVSPPLHATNKIVSDVRIVIRFICCTPFVR